MPRPREYHPNRAASVAERMRRYRAKQKNPPAPPREMAELLARKGVKATAAYLGMSERKQYYTRQYYRCRAFEWDDDILDPRGPHKVGISFVADMCKHGDESIQRLIHDIIKTTGRTEARMVWRAYRAAVDQSGSFAVKLREARQKAAYAKSVAAAKRRIWRHRMRLIK